MDNYPYTEAHNFYYVNFSSSSLQMKNNFFLAPYALLKRVKHARSLKQSLENKNLSIFLCYNYF